MLSRFTLFSLLLASFATLTNASTLIWDSTEAHIELKPNEEEARHIYTVTNRGDKTVRIARVKTSCGCTGSIVDKKIIEPGESAEIVGTFHKGKRQGLNRNRLEIYIDSQPDAVATLLMNVRIPTLIEAMPQIIYWSPQSSKSPRSVRLTLDERYIDKILNIDYDHSQLKVTEEQGDPKSDVDRVLIVEPKDYTTLYRGTITIHGSGPDGRKAETRVHAFVQP